MNLKGEEKEFTLEAVAYEFPDGIGEYDANWLNVKVHVRENEQHFEKIDPFLMTEDLQRIVNWFETLPNPTYREIGFIEPNLCFEYMGEKNGAFEIDVHLTLEITPPWVTADTHVMKFFIPEAEREEIVQLLRQQVEKFPIRA